MMDAEAFALARNTQHRQLAIRFPQMGVDTTQAKWIVDSINEHFSMLFLAAVILMLPSACQAAVAAACNHASDPAELLVISKRFCFLTNPLSLPPRLHRTLLAIRRVQQPLAMPGVCQCPLQ
jgi:hypothetical protein